MKKFLFILALLMLCGSCEPVERKTCLEEETVDVTDPWGGYSYVYVDSTKYLRYKMGDNFGLANTNTCTIDHQKFVDQIVDSLRAIIKEEIRVRLILTRTEENDSTNTDAVNKVRWKIANRLGDL